MARYAEGTSVPSEKSKMEIETALRKYGATGFLSGWQDTRAFIEFKISARHVRLTMTLPDPAAKAFTEYKRGYNTHSRSADQAHALWEQACRQRWRAMLLVIKAKLEAVEAGISVFEDEFMAHIVLPDGKTVSEHVRPALALAYEHGSTLPLLPDYTH